MHSVFHILTVSGLIFIFPEFRVNVILLEGLCSPDFGIGVVVSRIRQIVEY